MPSSNKGSEIKTVIDLLDHLPLLSVNLGQIPLPTALEMDFDLFLPGHGWAAPERDDRQWFRWLSREASIQLSIARSEPIRCELRVHAFVDENILERCRLLCDDQPIQMQLGTSPSGRSFVFELPIRSMDHVKLTTLRLQSDYVQKAGGDERPLSIAFSKLYAAPASQRSDVRDPVLPLFLQSITNDVLRVLAAGDPVTGARARRTFRCRAIGDITHSGLVDLEHGESWTFLLSDAGYASFNGSLRFDVAKMPRLALRFRFRRDGSTGSMAAIFDQDFEVVVSRANVFDDLSVMPLEPISTLQIEAVVALVEALPDILEPFVGQRAALPPALLPLMRKGITIDMGHALGTMPGVESVSGLSDTEVWPGFPIRWTASRDVLIVMSDIPTCAIEVTVQVQSVFEPCLPCSVCFTCGTYSETIQVEAATRRLTFAVPADKLGKTLSMTLPRAISPAECGIGDDPRNLCLAVSAIHIGASDQECLGD